MRLSVTRVADRDHLLNLAFGALEELSKRSLVLTACYKAPLESCADLLIGGGAMAMITQTRVHDPDFLAEFSAYYSRQFIDISRFCTRLHFFRADVAADESILSFLDKVDPASYLGFVTLRPVLKSPVGVTILSSGLSNGEIRGLDHFPVNLGGVKFSVHGTPFMQQDNAVGACAQASIWMALRTLRKREGDRAYDPAQITDAATRYLVTGRVRPNREGLTPQQMIEAIRSAGYAPHQIHIGSVSKVPLSQPDIHKAKKTLHAYVESGIPIVLVVVPPSGGHAVVVIGKSIVEKPVSFVDSEIVLSDGSSLSFRHAISWSSSLLIHNDNAGPYRELPDVLPNGEGYDFQYSYMAIPLLRTDIFMSGEEAFAIGSVIVADIFQNFATNKLKDSKELGVLANDLAIRLLLVEKRRLREWATEVEMPTAMSEQLRLMDLPKRVWIFELHRANLFGTVDGTPAASMVGLVLIDPTADVLPYSILLLYLNLPDLVGLEHGSLVKWDTGTGAPAQGYQTNEIGPITPVRHG